MKQLNFDLPRTQMTYGGSQLVGQRKLARPFSSQHAIHLVFSSENEVKMRRHYKTIKLSIESYAQKFGVTVYRYAICNNHIHMLAQFSNRILYRRFIRTFTGRLSAQLKIKWRHRPFSRLVRWGEPFKIALSYVVQNRLEAAHEIPHQPRFSEANSRRRRGKDKIQLNKRG